LKIGMLLREMFYKSCWVW